MVTQPSLEDAILGASPGLPKMHFYNPVLTHKEGIDIMRADRGFAFYLPGGVHLHRGDSKKLEGADTPRFGPMR